MVNLRAQSFCPLSCPFSSVRPETRSPYEHSRGLSAWPPPPRIHANVLYVPELEPAQDLPSASARIWHRPPPRTSGARPIYA